jgi:hypothetical protein
MVFSLIVQDYFKWHYTRAFGELFHVWLNFLWFTIHFFSLPELIRSWASPWKRMVESKGEGFNLEAYISYIVINLLSRVIGFIARSFVISAGLLTLSLVIIIGISLYLVWILLPLSIVASFVIGIGLLISNAATI